VFNPGPRHTKDFIQMVPDVSLLGAQHLATAVNSVSYKCETLDIIFAIDSVHFCRIPLFV